MECVLSFIDFLIFHTDDQAIMAVTIYVCAQCLHKTIYTTHTHSIYRIVCYSLLLFRNSFHIFFFSIWCAESNVVIVISIDSIRYIYGFISIPFPLYSIFFQFVPYRTSVGYLFGFVQHSHQQINFHNIYYYFFIFHILSIFGMHPSMYCYCMCAYDTTRNIRYGLHWFGKCLVDHYFFCVFFFFEYSLPADSRPWPTFNSNNNICYFVLLNIPRFPSLPLSISFMHFVPIIIFFCWPLPPQIDRAIFHSIHIARGRTEEQIDNFVGTLTNDIDTSHAYCSQWIEFTSTASLTYLSGLAMWSR